MDFISVKSGNVLGASNNLESYRRELHSVGIGNLLYILYLFRYLELFEVYVLSSQIRSCTLLNHSAFT